MITIEVKLENDFDTQFINVNITEEELRQFACNKAKGMYMDNYWTGIASTISEIVINSKL